MPQGGIRHFPGLPLLERRERGGNHSAVNRIENQDNPCQCLLLLREFRVVLVEHGLRELQSELRSRVFGFVYFFHGDDLHVLSAERRPISWELRGFFASYMKQ